ncbi:hypothetical protein [Anaerostipes caccae]|jgi:hypothetical protein|uniref:Uncharacterized protein n=1 Tax=Anaerostipes caccae (strain DSM 14662 / CCUG 47493 / JCM 13470 / NCIMB 13811 / L1-92) TaxID=411490 RepID=B0MGG2_ANACD|nr:hypothetical protein [Anaerostipes caccae]EDR96803.1 hypothetical protein ANACAC_02673 [Anaerostipes caccae L1-92]
MQPEKPAAFFILQERLSRKVVKPFKESGVGEMRRLAYFAHP